MMNDPLATALSNIQNSEKAGKTVCKIKPVSTLIKKTLEILNKAGYIGEYSMEEDGKGGILTVNLIKNINKCNSIKPRYSVKKDNFEKYEKMFLPAKDFGLLVVSTNKGTMTHIEAKQKGLGGKLLAYCY